MSKIATIFREEASFDDIVREICESISGISGDKVMFV